MKKISVLLPVWMEEQNIVPVYTAIKEIFLQDAIVEYELIFIDDGSTDETLTQIKKLAATDSKVKYVSFSRNFGKDNALAAGLQYSTGDAVITMDADMQHPVSLIINLINEWKNGWDVVYYYRENNNAHAGLFTRFNSWAFYKLINFFADVKLESGISDFRIIDRKLVNVLVKMEENNLFFRGLVKWAGFKQLGLPYTPAAREHGVSKYKTVKLFHFAIGNITSFSTKPLTFAIYLGFIFSASSILYVPYAIISKINGVAISGWSSTIVTIAFFGGLNLIILGIVGLYLGKTFMQAKGRPNYIVDTSNIEKY